MTSSTGGATKIALALILGQSAAGLVPLELTTRTSMLFEPLITVTLRALRTLLGSAGTTRLRATTVLATPVLILRPLDNNAAT
ncbi:MAG: hypothetical protein AAGJ80_06080 [Cyanobacteria bacterium J06553_1]